MTATSLYMYDDANNVANSYCTVWALTLTWCLRVRIVD